MDWQHVMAWGIFLGIVVGMLGVDLLVLHRKPREIRFREAMLGTLLPVAGALVFMGAIYWAYNAHYLNLGVLPEGMAGRMAKHYPTNGWDAALLFFTGYAVELSLSADNVFLFVMLMGFFKVPRALQHRVLFWGVMGALVMRGLMVAAGAALLAKFAWLIDVFGVFLVAAGAKMFFSKPGGKDPTRSLAVAALRKALPMEAGFDGKRFFTRKNGVLMGTGLLLVLVSIEVTDLVFALDSIPAIFGITRDTFIVFTSNVFAILGLRSMYFLLSGVMDRFGYLKAALAAVLAFVGVRMVLPELGEMYGHVAGGEHIWEIDQYVALSVIVGVLAAAVGGSLLFPAKREIHVRVQGSGVRV